MNRQFVITAENLEVWTSRGELLVTNLNFALRKGDYLLLKGENGSGKSTVAQTLMGFHRLYSGTLRLNIDRKDVGYLPQLGNVRFFLPLTLSDILGLETRDTERMERALAFGLLEPTQLKLSWNTASGGERQKTLIIRALLENPSLLILDEPFNHLDSPSRTKLMDVLNSLLDAQKIALLLISHDGEINARNPSHVIELGRSL